MKNTKSPLDKFLWHILAGLAVFFITSAISFVWATNNRLTKLETAFITISDDVHEIRVMLDKQKVRRGE